MPLLTDWPELEALFGIYLAGDSEAAQTLFTALLSRLQGYFRARLGAAAHAEDLVQATLLKIHFARDRYDPKRPLKTWVFTIASRALIDHWRGSASDRADEDPAAEGGPSPDLTPEQRVELQRDLNRALGFLKPTDRSIVYLYAVEGFSMAEIGNALGLTEGAVKLRAHRAYRELRKSLGS